MGFVCLGLVCVAVFAASVAHAQEPRFYGGARVSFNVSDVSAEQEYDPRFGVGGGLFVAGNAYKRLDIRLEANYSEKGARIAFSRSSNEWQMDYLEVPLLLVLNLSPRSETTFQIVGGVTYGFPLQRQVEVGDNVGYYLEDFTDRDIFVNNTTNLHINSVEDSELGVALGVGLSVPVGQVDFLIDLRYTTSLTDPVVDADFVVTTGQDDEIVVETTSTAFSNRVFTFFVGFAFPFGTRGAAAE